MRCPNCLTMGFEARLWASWPSATSSRLLETSLMIQSAAEGAGGRSSTWRTLYGRYSAPIKLTLLLRLNCVFVHVPGGANPGPGEDGADRQGSEPDADLAPTGGRARSWPSARPRGGPVGARSGSAARGRRPGWS